MAYLKLCKNVSYCTPTHTHTHCEKYTTMHHHYLWIWGLQVIFILLITFPCINFTVDDLQSSITLKAGFSKEEPLQQDTLWGVTRVLLGKGCFSRKDLVSYLYFPRAEVGAIQLAVFAEPGEDFGGFGCVSPSIVSFSEKWTKDRGWGPGFLRSRPPRSLWKDHLRMTCVVSFSFNLTFHLLGASVFILFSLFSGRYLCICVLAWKAELRSSLTEHFFSGSFIFFFLNKCIL